MIQRYGNKTKKVISSNVKKTITEPRYTKKETNVKGNLEIGLLLCSSIFARKIQSHSLNGHVRIN